MCPGSRFRLPGTTGNFSDSIFKQRGPRRPKPSLLGATRRSNPFFLCAAKMDCFASARNDGEVHLRILAADFARVLLQRPALTRTEGAGNAGRSLRPQPRMQNKNKHTSVVTTVTPVSPGIPRAMVLTAYNVLSPGTGLSCPRRQRGA